MLPQSPNRRDLLRHAGTLAAGASILGACGAARTRTAPLSAERDAAIDELFADLSDQRASVAPIGAEEQRERRERCGRILAERGLDAFVIEPGATMTYLTGISWHRSERLFALVVLADGAFFWLCPAFEAGKARLRIDGRDGPGGPLVTWEEHEYPYAPLAAELSSRRVARIALDPALRHVFAARLATEVGVERMVPLAGTEIVVLLRAQKDPHELAILRRANELTQQALVAVSRRLRPGLSGREIGALVDRAHKKLGFGSPWNLSLIGPAAAFPHGEQDDLLLERGSVLLIDTGGSFHGYQSDITRTWVFDAQPEREVVAVWNAVRDAQRRAFDAMRPGIACGAIDAVARERIDAAGYGPGYRTFTHRLGHGIGLEGHEDPYFDGGSRTLLAPGMTLSNEPGIYLLERFGVRLEDIVAIVPDGAEHFGDWQRAPSSPA